MYRGGRAAALAALLILALVSVGCGGGDSTETSAVSKAVFVREANGICEDAGKRKAVALEKATDRPILGITKEQGDQLVAKVVLPIYREQAKELGDLEAPKRQDVAAFLVKFEKGIAISTVNPNSALSGKAFASANKAAAELGLVKCSF